MTAPLPARLTEAADRLQSGLVTTAGPIRALLREAATELQRLETARSAEQQMIRHLLARLGEDGQP